MMHFEFIDPAVSAKICMTLFHSLWQIGLLYGLLWIAERFAAMRGGKHVEVFYALHVAALAFGLAALPITWLFLDGPMATAATAEPSKSTLVALSVNGSSLPRSQTELEWGAAESQAAPLFDHSIETHEGALDEFTAGNSAASAIAPISTASAILTAEPAKTSTWGHIAPWLVSAYIIGVAFMLFRLVFAIWASGRLARRATRVNGGPLMNILQRLARDWNMGVTPTLAAAETVIVPQILGLWRPVILLPSSALSGMTPDELEMILIHEMAHLKRHDMWVNLLQRLSEAVLFFNPALWILNRRISLLREYCCDDLTVATQASKKAEPRLRYATALLKVVELCSAERNRQPELAALASSGQSPSELRKRIARLFGEPLREPIGISRGALLAVIGAVLLLVGPMLWPANGADDDTPDAAPLAQVGSTENTAVPSPKAPAISATDKKKTQILRGTVTDDKGDPVRNVKITLYSGVATRFKGQETTTNANGEYRFEPHSTMQHMGGFETPYAFTGMTFVHSEYVPQDGLSFRDVPIESRDQVFDLVMIRGGRVKGVVTNHETGQPIPDLGLRMGNGFFKGQKDGRFMIYATTDAKGEFEFDPAPPQKYVIEINDNTYRDKYRYLKIGQVTVKSGETSELQLQDAGLKQLEDPFRITGTARGTDGKSMVYGGVGVKLVNSDGKLRSRGGGIDGRPVFGLTFGPIDRSEPTESSPYGIGTHDVEIFGSNSRFGYRLKSRTPAEPLRITDDPNMPELKDGIRYIRPGKPLEFKLVYAPDPDMKRMFSLKVVGPDGKPVPHAKVQLRTNPAVAKDQIHRGEYVKDGRYGNEAIANKDGELYFTLLTRPSRFNLKIQTPGFGPYWAGWSPGRNGESIPDKFTAQLDAGWSVGGIVVDEDGKPVQGVEVNPSVQYKKRPGDTSRLGVGTRIKTDADGKWKFECVPASKSDVHVEVSHPSFQPHYQRLARDTFGLEGDAQPSARIQLKRGLSVTGTVTDEAGRPIEGALVRTKFVNDLREAKTNKDGVYKLEGCDEKMARIVVSAKGKATDLQTVRVDPDLEPVNFVMKPGGHVKVRVVDENGKGIPNAEIFYQDWRGQQARWEFGHRSGDTDENGVWEWNEAPLDEFTADICRPGGMQLSGQRLFAREEEFVFTPPPALVVSGSVIDAKTKKRIPKFRVTPGLRNENPRIKMDWDRRSSFEASNGAYRVAQTEDAIAHVVRIEADGYKVAISRDIRNDEGKIIIDFELEPAKDITATIQSAEGVPTGGAKIALGVAGSQITIKNGDIDDGSTYATRVDADAKGVFSIPAREESFQMVITHPEGFAHIKVPEQEIGKFITLTPWARGEGTFRIGNTPVPNVSIELYANGLHSYGDDVPNIFTHDRTTTGKEGRYVFPRLFPGKGRIGRGITLMVDDGATEVTSSIRQSAQFVSGKTTTLNLGGSGSPVIGKLVPPDDYQEKVLWNFAVISAEADLQPPMPDEAPADVADDPERRRGWWEAWKTTTQGKKWLLDYQEYERIRDEYPYITATVDRDGSFRIDDVPPGKYLMSVRFSGRNQASPGVLRDYRFKVPVVEDGESPDAVQLGDIRLQ